MEAARPLYAPDSPASPGYAAARPTKRKSLPVSPVGVPSKKPHTRSASAVAAAAAATTTTTVATDDDAPGFTVVLRGLTLSAIDAEEPAVAAGASASNSAASGGIGSARAAVCRVPLPEAASDAEQLEESDSDYEVEEPEDESDDDESGDDEAGDEERPTVAGAGEVLLEEVMLEEWPVRLGPLVYRQDEDLACREACRAHLQTAEEVLPASGAIFTYDPSAWPWATEEHAKQFLDRAAAPTPLAATRHHHMWGQTKYAGCCSLVVWCSLVLAGCCDCPGPVHLFELFLDRAGPVTLWEFDWLLLFCA